MPVINTIKPFVDSRGLSVYRFRKDTGLAQATAYRLYNNSYDIPSGEVLKAICSAYKIQPGEILQWIPDESEELDRNRPLTAGGKT